MNQHLKQAIAAARAGKKPQAKVLLARVIKDEPDNVNAWFLLSSLADTEEQKVQHLQKVLELQPNHPTAAEQLGELVPMPEPVEEAVSGFAADMPEMDVEEDDGTTTDIFPLPEVDLPPAEAPEDPDEAMAWLERLAADQGAPLEELPSITADEMDTADATLEMPALDFSELEAPLETETDSEADAPEDPDEAMAWLERLAADQGANLEELPSLFEGNATQEAPADIEDDFSWMDEEVETAEAPGDGDYSWLDEEMAKEDDFLGSMPTTIETPEDTEEAAAQTARMMTISEDFDFVSQSKGDSIPAWLAGEEDYIGAETVQTEMPEEEEVVKQPEFDNLPDWLNQGSMEGWEGDERDKSGQVMWKAGDGDDMKPAAPGSKKAKEQETKPKARRAAKQKTAAASGGNNLYLALLIFVAIVLAFAIFYILIVQPL